MTLKRRFINEVYSGNDKQYLKERTGIKGKHGVKITEVTK